MFLVVWVMSPRVCQGSIKTTKALGSNIVKKRELSGAKVAIRKYFFLFRIFCLVLLRFLVFWYPKYIHDDDDLLHEIQSSRELIFWYPKQINSDDNLFLDCNERIKNEGNGSSHQMLRLRSAWRRGQDVLVFHDVPFEGSSWACRRICFWATTCSIC